MGYRWMLANNREITIEDLGNCTTVTTTGSGAGQESRSTNSFSTGTWLQPPQFTPTATGGRIEIKTTTGDVKVVIDGDSTSVVSNGINISSTQTNSSSQAIDLIPPIPNININIGNMW
jgi:hypothetical protein